MGITIQHRRGTAAQWTAANPVLANGEPGYETDTGLLKYGDGVTAWVALGYVQPIDHAANHVTGGGDTIADVVAGGNAGLMTGADKTKLDGIAIGALAVGYCLQAGAALLPVNPDSQTYYWGGSKGEAPGTVAAIRRVYFPKAGTIKAANVYVYAATAGSNENWSMSIRINDTTDTLIQTLGANTNSRLWANYALAIAVVAGDYFEIKEVTPVWGTNPANVTRNGVIYVE
jgi:hypothetical protein